MDTSNVEEVRPLIPRSGILTTVHDIRQPYEKRLAVYFILASILFERIAFYSLTNNIVPTLQSNKTLGWDHQHSSTASFMFFGTRYIATLVFAALCDSKLGRTRTIIIGFSLYVIGYIFIIINANENVSFCDFHHIKHHNTSSIFSEPCAPWILSMLLCTAIAAGTVQANLAVFGAEQIRNLKIISLYSDKFMIAVNIGDLLSLLVIPYIEKHPENYYIGYIVGASMLVAAILLFIIGYRYCIHVKPYDSVVTNCIPVFINAFQSWREHKKYKCSIEIEHTGLSPALLRTRSYSLNSVQGSRLIDTRSPTFLDFAKETNNGKFPDRIVDDVKSLQYPIIVFGLLIPYWLIYSQINSTFIQQGEKMKLPYDTMPIIWMTFAEPVTVIIGIFILDTFIYKHLNSWNKEVIIATKFIIGMCVALISMCTAGIVEVLRQEKCIGKEKSSLTIYAQLPQNIFIGLSELFAVVASYEFAYFAAPRSAQSLFMSLRFTAAGVASFIGIAFSNVFLKAANDDSNSNCLGYNESWRYHTYFFILAGLQLLFIIIFIICYKKFRIVTLNAQQMDTDDLFEH